MLDVIWREIPEIYNFAYTMYNGSPQLPVSDFTILSEEGPQQGDPLRSLEFCLTIQPLLMSLSSELKIGFLDDITISGHRDIQRHQHYH